MKFFNWVYSCRLCLYKICLYAKNFFGKPYFLDLCHEKFSESETGNYIKSNICLNLFSFDNLFKTE